MKKDYLTRLSRFARWYLPPAEAAEVIEDYQGLLAEDPTPEEQDLGEPRKAVQLLTRPKEVRLWLAVFCLLSLLALGPSVSGLYSLPLQLGIYATIPGLESFWEFYQYHSGLLAAGLPLAGTVLVLIWFQKNGWTEPGKPPLRKMLPLLSIQAVGMLLAWGIFWLSVQLEANNPAVSAWVQQHLRYVRWGSLALELAGPICGALGLLGLVRARLEDRRWRSVYILGLSAAALCTAVFSMQSSMSLDCTSAAWWLLYFRRYLLISAVGFAGAGAGLC